MKNLPRTGPDKFKVPGSRCKASLGAGVIRRGRRIGTDMQVLRVRHGFLKNCPGKILPGPGRKPWAAGILIFLLIFSASIRAAPARETPSPEEAALFSLADLGPLDLSPKTLEVEIFIAPDPDLASCRRLLPLAWPLVQSFYSRLGVNLVLKEGLAGPLAPAQRLRVELLGHKDWLARSFKAFKVEPPFRLRFLQVCRDKCAFAHLPLSVIHISFKKFEELELASQPGEALLHRQWLANLLIHELGHLLGLYHAHEFVNDPIPAYLPGKIPNFMSQEIVSRTELGWVDYQKRLIHSFLGRGKVYQQYLRVDFDPLCYLELIKKHNNYREPPAAKTGAAGKPGKKGRPRTFTEDDEEDDE